MARSPTTTNLYLALIEAVCELRAFLVGENDGADTHAVIEKAEAALAEAGDLA